MHFLQFSDRDMRVYLRRANIAMSEHGLDVSQVCPILQHVRRHRMAQQVATSRHIDARLYHVAFYFVAQFSISERVTIII